mmetsp:Transcript_25810/g.97211  ORF Transcript_25810/g.97211 Transcript_25810/m.97211 type:complete len:274 (+) Transcript_25810:748-1569(+)
MGQQQGAHVSVAFCCSLVKGSSAVREGDIGNVRVGACIQEEAAHLRMPSKRRSHERSCTALVRAGVCLVGEQQPDDPGVPSPCSVVERREPVLIGLVGHNQSLLQNFPDPRSVALSSGREEVAAVLGQVAVLVHRFGFSRHASWRGKCRWASDSLASRGIGTHSNKHGRATSLPAGSRHASMGPPGASRAAPGRLRRHPPRNARSRAASHPAGSVGKLRQVQGHGDVEHGASGLLVQAVRSERLRHIQQAVHAKLLRRSQQRERSVAVNDGGI